MKKSILIALAALFIHGTNAFATQSQPAQSLYAEQVTYTDAFKSNLVTKIEYEPDYAQTYFKSLVTLIKAEKAVALALADIGAKTKNVENKMYGVIAKTGRLKDGTPIFVSTKITSKFYAIDGRELTLDEIKSIAITTVTLPWEDYLALYDERKKHMDEKAEVIVYRDETLLPTRSKMPNPEELALSQKRLRQWAAYKQENL